MVGRYDSIYVKSSPPSFSNSVGHSSARPPRCLCSYPKLSWSQYYCSVWSHIWSAKYKRGWYWSKCTETSQTEPITTTTVPPTEPVFLFSHREYVPPTHVLYLPFERVFSEAVKASYQVCCTFPTFIRCFCCCCSSSHGRPAFNQPFNGDTITVVTSTHSSVALLYTC